MAINTVVVSNTPNQITLTGASTKVEAVVVETQVTLDNEVTTVLVAQNKVNLQLVESPVAVFVQPATISIVTAATQGPAGVDGVDGIDGTGAVEISAGPILPAATLVVDSVAIATYRSVKWIVTLTDSVAGSYKSYEVLAIHNGTTALHTVYGRIGDPIDATTEVAVVGASLELQITNNNVNNIDIKAQRIVTTI